MYLLKLSLRPWRMAPLSQLFSAVAVGFLLLLAGFLGWMEQGMKPVLTRLKTEQVITAWIDASVEAREEARITDSIRMIVGSSAEEVQLMGAQDFLKDLQGHYPTLARELEDLGAEAQHLIPRYVSVSGMLPESAINGIRAISGIESAESSKDRYHQIIGAFLALRRVAKLLVAGLCLALLTGLIHLARMNAWLQEDALALLRQWGAGMGSLCLPSVISGLGVGLAGGAIAAGGWYLGGSWLAQHIRALSPLLQEMPLPSFQTGLILLAVSVGLGVISGALGAMVSGVAVSGGRR